MPGGDLPKLHSETLQEDGPQGNFPLRSTIGMVFVMLESIFDFHERWALHSLEVPMWGKTSNKQQVRELFWYHCKPLEFVRSEANLTTTPLEPLWRA